jgi:ubiquinone/menaquinone biosynthesis C-methylase UbiE
MVMKPEEQTGGTNRDRWIDVSGSWGVKNPERTKITAKHIPSGSRVLDLGAGTMILKKFLSEDCEYQPCDLFSRSPDCIVADFNKGEFPIEEQYDWVTLIGLFQFLNKPMVLLKKCNRIAKHAVVTYSPIIHDKLTKKELLWRRGEGWNNHFTLNQYLAIVRKSGWEVEKAYKIPANIVLICRNINKPDDHG